MITTFAGPNSYVLQKALREKRRAFIAQFGDLALETIDVSDWELRKVLDTLGALPFLSPNRLLILHGLAANKPAAEQIDKLLESVSETTNLVIVESKIDKRSVLYKTLKKQTEFHDCTELDARDASRWVTSEVKSRGGGIGLSEANYLVSRIGATQQLISSEIDKLMLYQPVITRATIDVLTEQVPLSSIFELIDAAFSGNFARALALYADQRAQNVEPLAIEALFVWQLHSIVLMKAAGNTSSDTVAAQAGISPYVARKSAGLAAKRTLGDLRQYVAELADLEYTVKTTTVDADELMKNYILSLGQ